MDALQSCNPGNTFLQKGIIFRNRAESVNDITGFSLAIFRIIMYTLSMETEMPSHSGI